ncbi:hypothetical protein [Heliorestis convoluta]|uniref:hypothetical protein n=1 Tax=Heliorestis convoluta TaxID=356322 RepID=UPI001A9BCBBF|nr:hypothetical protein [Heliorestis convoluta]
MNIKVEVSLKAPDLVESIERLIRVLPYSSIINEEKEKPAEQGVTEPKQQEQPKPSSKNKQQAKEVANVKEGQAPEVTLEQVRSKLAALSQEGKQAEVKALITEFNAKKLSDIPRERYAELLERAGGL